nr:AAA family ATPase [Cellulomonas septica]
MPLNEGNAYAAREEAEADIRRFLGRDQVPVVFGEYGVGKTTVVRKVLQELGEEPRMVYLPTASGKRISDVFKMSLESLGYTVEVEESSTKSRGATAGAKLIFEGQFEEASEVTKVRRLVVDSPTDSKVAAVLRDAKMTLVIDELHRASEDFRTEIADLIKTTHGQDSNFPQIILIGTTLDSAALVSADRGIDRFIKELRISPMTDEEARALITSGFDTLRMSLGEEILTRIVRTSAGAPSLIQSLCLDIAESCLAAGRSTVLADDYEAAVAAYLKENGHRLAEVYTRAIEHTGPRKYRKQILISMSLIDDEFFELETIRAHIEERTGLPVQQTALSGPLRELKTGSESILQDVSKRDGDRVYNLSAFRDPMMKSFIRFMNEVEAQGLYRP